MKNLLKLLLVLLIVLLSIFLISYCVYEMGKDAANKAEEKAELERKIKNLEQPVFFSSGEEIFVIVKGTQKDFNNSFMFINNTHLLKAHNYSDNKFTGIYRIPKKIEFPFDRLALIIPDKKNSGESQKVPPIYLDLSKIGYAHLQSKNTREQDNSEDLMDELPEKNEACFGNGYHESIQRKITIPIE